MTKRSSLTTPDLVVLSLLSEQPAHGYQVVAELERRDVRDWAAISRPQVYYSLQKLADLKLLEEVPSAEQSGGPERKVWQPTAEARRALAEALTHASWTQQRPPNPFITWLALSLHARPATVRKQIQRRKAYVEAQLEKERETLIAVRADTGPTIPIGELVVSYGISAFELELEWLNKVEKKLVVDERE